MDNRKRRIPRHVDGRFMIGRMHWKPFLFKFLPLVVLDLILLFQCLTPLTLFLAVVIGGSIYFFFSEINYRETGFSIFKDYLRYKKQGSIIYERSTVNDGITFRYIRHKEKYE